MNFEYKINQAVTEAEKALKQALELQEKYNDAKDFTAKFLDECLQRGIKKVSVGKRHKSIPASIDWPFGEQGSVFQMSDVRENGFPAIWGVCNKLGISGGAGNTDQHQIKSDTNIVDGVYHFKSGSWLKVE